MKILFILKSSKFGCIIFSFSIIFFLIFISLFIEIFNLQIFINSSFIFDFASSLSLITIKIIIIISYIVLLSLNAFELIIVELITD